MAKTLSREEEFILGTRIQKGLEAKRILENGVEDSGEEISDEKRRLYELRRSDYSKARDEFVENNIQLVKKCANYYWRHYPIVSLEYEDLVQEGLFGLFSAIDKFDPSKGNKFSTLAWPWVNQSINRGINKTNRLVRLPENRVTDFIKMNNTAKEMGKPLNDESVIAEIKRRFGYTDDDVYSIRNAAGEPVSLNQKVSADEGDSKELGDYVMSGTSESSETSHYRSYMRSMMRESLNSLTPFERDFVLAEFGFESPLYDVNKPKLSRAKRVREHYGMTREQYFENSKSAIEKMKRFMEFRNLTYEDIAM